MSSTTKTTPQPRYFSSLISLSFASIRPGLQTHHEASYHSSFAHLLCIPCYRYCGRPRRLHARRKWIRDRSRSLRDFHSVCVRERQRFGFWIGKETTTYCPLAQANCVQEPNNRLQSIKSKHRQFRMSEKTAQTICPPGNETVVIVGSDGYAGLVSSFFCGSCPLFSRQVPLFCFFNLAESRLHFLSHPSTAKFLSIP